jgi:hypothetical protein
MSRKSSLQLLDKGINGLFHTHKACRIPKPKIQTSINYVKIDTHENAKQVAKIQRDR